MSVSTITGPQSGQDRVLDVPNNASDAQVKDAADKVFLQAQMNSANLFYQQLPGNCTPGQLIGELMEKSKSAGNDGDPAAANLDTGV